MDEQRKVSARFHFDPNDTRIQWTDKLVYVTYMLPMKATSQLSSYLSVFGRIVSSERARLGLSQEALAERAGFHRAYIGDIERGQRNVALLNIVRLASALETTPEQLLQKVSLAVAAIHSQERDKTGKETQS